jgi:hypothetical protein
MGIKLSQAPLELQKRALKALAEQYPEQDGYKMKPPKRSKYGNKRTLYDGIWFDSGAEAERYKTLKLWQSAGIITNLELQPQYPCVINGKKCFLYKADFRYTRDGKQVIEDVKGMRTDVYIVKKKVIEALFGIEIMEISIKK